MSTEHERNIALMEVHIIVASDAYFKERQELFCLETSRTFDAGFNMAWNVQSERLEYLKTLLKESLPLVESRAKTTNALISLVDRIHAEVRVDVCPF